MQLIMQVVILLLDLRYDSKLESVQMQHSLIINKKNRVKDVIVELENNQLTLKVITDEKIYNEKLEIELQKENFENTFGIKLSMKEINN